MRMTNDEIEHIITSTIARSKRDGSSQLNEKKRFHSFGFFFPLLVKLVWLEKKINPYLSTFKDNNSKEEMCLMRTQEDIAVIWNLIKTNNFQIDRKQIIFFLEYLLPYLFIIYRQDDQWMYACIARRRSLSSLPRRRCRRHFSLFLFRSSIG